MVMYNCSVIRSNGRRLATHAPWLLLDFEFTFFCFGCRSSWSVVGMHGRPGMVGKEGFKKNATTIP